MTEILVLEVQAFLGISRGMRWRRFGSGVEVGGLEARNPYLRNATREGIANASSYEMS
jgi:hypothetical protein